MEGHLWVDMTTMVAITRSITAPTHEVAAVEEAVVATAVAVVLTMVVAEVVTMRTTKALPQSSMGLPRVGFPLLLVQLASVMELLRPQVAQVLVWVSLRLQSTSQAGVPTTATAAVNQDIRAGAGMLLLHVYRQAAITVHRVDVTIMVVTDVIIADRYVERCLIQRKTTFRRGLNLIP